MPKATRSRICINFPLHWYFFLGKLVTFTKVHTCVLVAKISIRNMAVNISICSCNSGSVRSTPYVSLRISVGLGTVYPFRPDVPGNSSSLLPLGNYFGTPSLTWLSSSRNFVSGTPEAFAIISRKCAKNTLETHCEHSRKIVADFRENTLRILERRRPRETRSGASLWGDPWNTLRYPLNTLRVPSKHSAGTLRIVREIAPKSLLVIKIRRKTAKINSSGQNIDIFRPHLEVCAGIPQTRCDLLYLHLLYPLTGGSRAISSCLANTWSCRDIPWNKTSLVPKVR